MKDKTKKKKKKKSRNEIKIYLMVYLNNQLYSVVRVAHIQFICINEQKKEKMNFTVSFLSLI
jgi:hypothetical protein